MRNYFILSFNRTIGAVNHIYNAVRTGNDYTGNYVCATLEGPEATKISTDFICMPHSTITGIKDNNRRLEFRVGETTTQGRITAIRLNNRRAEVLLNAARTVYTDIATLTKPVVASVVQPVRTTAAAAVAANPSRSNQPADPFLTLQQRIEAVPDIRLDKLLKKNIPATLKDFLVKFFKTYNEEKNTIFLDKRIQTDTGRRRSLGDIYKLCKYYYPTCTLKDVLTLLYVTLPVTITRGFRTSYCNTIRKRVWYYDENSANGVYDTGTDDEYGNRLNWYTTKL